MPDYDKNLPDGNKNANLLDDDVQQNFEANEDRLAVEHYFPDNANPVGYGRHKFGFGDVSERDAAIPSPQNGNIWWRTDLTAFDIFIGIWATTKGHGYGTIAQRDAIPTSSINAGYAWIDSDSGIITYWDGSNWVALTGLGIPFSRNSVPGVVTYEIPTGSWFTVDTVGPAGGAPLRVQVTLGAGQDAVVTGRAAMSNNSGSPRKVEMATSWFGSFNGRRRMTAVETNASSPLILESTVRIGGGAGGVLTFELELGVSGSGVDLNDLNQFERSDALVTDLEVSIVNA